MEAAPRKAESRPPDQERRPPAALSDASIAARVYCAHGWSIVPARVEGKRALVAWKRWQRELPGLELVERWWARWPGANLAVVTGRVSGIVVVDIDPRHNGDLALAELETLHGDLPWRAVVETPSGGWHVYLRHPGGRVRNSSGRIGAGVDVRGDGGLALLPPSRRAAGVYRWAVGGPEQVPPMAPAWVELLRPRPRPRQPAPAPRLGHGGHHASRLAGLLRVLQRAPEGQRNGALYWAGCRLRELLDQGAPEHWAEELIHAGVAVGLAVDECRSTVASALGRV